MPCRTTQLPNGVTATVCSRDHRKRQQLCSCGRRATLECDWPSETRKSGTCDKPICQGCATSKDGKDYCPFHRGEPPKTQAELDADGEAAADFAAKMLGVKRG